MKGISTAKIQIFLKDHTNIMKDYEVVYLMVEIRKILDQVREFKPVYYPLLHFYTDWIVHAQKDRITKEIKEYMKKVDKTIPVKPFIEGLADAYDQDFLEFDELRTEMSGLLNEMTAPTFICEQFHWANFTAALAYALIDQPIIKPIPTIDEFVFKPAPIGLRRLQITFNDVRGVCTYMATPSYPEEDLGTNIT